MTNLMYRNSEDINIIEIGIDEAGRGPLLGRVYSAAVILPCNKNDFNHTLLKDSKKFSSEKKIKEASEYIKENALAWSICYETEEQIDKINIREATLKSMHSNINKILNKLNKENNLILDNVMLMIDGCDFKPYSYIDNTHIISYKPISHICIEKGDNKYCNIAAASILAKVARDEYIKELCLQYPSLIDKYDILNNKGYGTKKHIEGIKIHGITSFHRKTYGICKNYTY